MLRALALKKVNVHDVESLAAPAEFIPDGRPLVVLAYTNTYEGMDILKERAPKLHYVRFKNEEERRRYEAFLMEKFPPSSESPGPGEVSTQWKS